ncbi:VOC family protein [Dysgonomonas reticulitermitis]
MKFSNVRLLVKDYAKCFKFYTEQLGLEALWGDENSGYASFKVTDGMERFALFVSDWMAPSVSNADKELPVGFREKSLVSFSVDNVDDTYAVLKAKGVIFVNEPTDMAGWGMRTVHLRDPEDNLIELFSPLAPEQWSEELIEESKKYE